MAAMAGTSSWRLFWTKMDGMNLRIPGNAHNFMGIDDLMFVHRDFVLRKGIPKIGSRWWDWKMWKPICRSIQFWWIEHFDISLVFKCLKPRTDWFHHSILVNSILSRVWKTSRQFYLTGSAVGLTALEIGLILSTKKGTWGQGTNKQYSNNRMFFPTNMALLHLFQGANISVVPLKPWMKNLKAISSYINIDWYVYIYINTYQHIPNHLPLSLLIETTTYSTIPHAIPTNITKSLNIW